MSKHIEESTQWDQNSIADKGRYYAVVSPKKIAFISGAARIKVPNIILISIDLCTVYEICHCVEDRRKKEIKTNDPRLKVFFLNFLECCFFRKNKNDQPKNYQD